MYKLEMAKQNDCGWFVGVKKDPYLYLRKSLDVLDSTGWSDSKNNGYWETEIEANKARQRYYEKFASAKEFNNKISMLLNYADGKLLIETRMLTMTFRFLGMDFTSNKNRKSPYRFNSTTWTIHDISIIEKINMILSKRVVRIK